MRKKLQLYYEKDKGRFFAVPYREPHNPIICAVFSIAFGLDFMLAERGSFTSGTYKVALEIPQYAWGAAFITAGILVLWRRRPWTAGLLLGTFVVWWSSLISAKLLGYSTSSWQGVSIWTAVIAMLWMSLRRYGTGAGR